MPPPSDILLEHLPLVERIIRKVCGGRMDASHIEEFSGFVRLRLIENDYAILRAFIGRSSIGTYLTTVVARLLNDYRNHEWGKWHASAEAKRQGNLGLDLERLIVRDARPLNEAFRILLPDYPGITKAELEELAARFPKRHRRRMVGLDQRPEPSVASGAHDVVSDAETGALISKVVCAFIDRLPGKDQLLLQFRFEGDMTVPEIAKSLGEDAQSLYRRLRLRFAELREELEKAGVSLADAAKLIGSDGAVLDFKLKNKGRRPSNEDDPGAAPEEDA
jgi:RNA polymerase sigma factor (sigma-70 family)